MTIYIVWYINPELSPERAAMWGIYSTKERAEKELKKSGFKGWVNEENVED